MLRSLAKRKSAKTIFRFIVQSTAYQTTYHKFSQLFLNFISQTQSLNSSKRQLWVWSQAELPLSLHCVSKRFLKEYSRKNTRQRTRSTVCCFTWCSLCWLRTWCDCRALRTSRWLWLLLGNRISAKTCLLSLIYRKEGIIYLRNVELHVYKSYFLWSKFLSLNILEIKWFNMFQNITPQR